MPPTPAALRAAVLGSPIDHSKSPRLHSAAYRYLGLDIDYSRAEVQERDLGEFLTHTLQVQGIDEAAKWVGWSVTMPLKAAMVPHMNSTSARVRTLGVLNTVVISPGADRLSVPTLHGENTDVDGIVAAFADAGFHKTSAVAAKPEGIFGVLGAGGTAAAALAAAQEMGFGSAVVYARSPERAASLEAVADALGLALLVRPLDMLHLDLAEGRVPTALVSTLPPRTADSWAADLPKVPTGTPLLDVAYEPWPSALAAGWQAAGGVVVSGLNMLLHQAVRQVHLFTAATERPAGTLSPDEHAQMVDSMRAALGSSGLLN